MRECENMRTGFAARLLAFALLAAFVPCAFGASVCYEGRYLGTSGDVKANVQVPATIRAYASENAASALGSAETTIATDAEGRFAATVENLDVPVGYTTFWIGVTPQGSAEIKPRMRVSPAPFAIVAANVGQVESTDAMTIDGELTANRVENADAAADNVVLTEDSTLRGSVNGVKDLYVRNLYLNSGNASLIRANAPNGVSTQWNDFDADYGMAVTDTTGFILGDTDQTKTDGFTAEDDGIVMVMIRVEISLEDRDYWVKATLSNGDFKILDDTLIGVTGVMNARLFTFPVRKGKKVSLKLHNHRDHAWWDVKSWAKAKVIYFGAN